MSAPPPFTALASFLRAHRHTRAEIEILPSGPFAASSPHAIQTDGPALAIRKPALAAAFVAARQVLFAGPASASAPAPEDLADATAVILLFAPEHATAANARKRALLRALGTWAPPAEPPPCLRAELALLDTLTGSPLRKHPKSPTLWAHRAWLVCGEPRRLRGFAAGAQAEAAARAEGGEGGGGGGGGPAAALWAAELRAVLAAAGRHFANYYAFGYARRLRAALRREWGGGFEGASLHAVRDWCVRHPADVSGWAFLAHLAAGDAPAQERLRREVHEYAEHVGARGEAVGWFLKAMRSEGE